MRERPILFSTPMIRALLAGTKTQTRRIVKSEHADDAAVWAYDEARGIWESGIASGAPGSFGHGEYVRCPYGMRGDRLWVRETWGPRAGGVVFRADDGNDPPDGNKWRPSIFMPRWASRITLEVTGVRVERLHDITEEDAKAEGVEPGSVESAAEKYGWLWTEINGAASWLANPFVWVVEFRRVTHPTAAEHEGGE